MKTGFQGDKGVGEVKGNRAQKGALLLPCTFVLLKISACCSADGEKLRVEDTGELREG